MQSARCTCLTDPSPARQASQPENKFSKIVHDQQIAIVPSFELESGAVLKNVPVAYKTFGTLAPDGKNAMVICHALTGSADAADWWGPLFGGAGKAFDLTRFFIVCLNSLGSPYGSASPVTNRDNDPSLGTYGPEFPLTTVRDDVNIFKLVLDDIGVKQIAAVIGGSMGGMLVLEFAYFGREYVRTIAPIATSARYSAWGISWGEAQRQSIYSDPKYLDGYYDPDDPPAVGLSAARMAALLTYRSRDSFESRFGRNVPDPARQQNINGGAAVAATKPPASPQHEAWAIHNDGHKNASSARVSRTNSQIDVSAMGSSKPTTTTNGDVTPRPNGKRPAPTYFSAQSYLRYQGNKFISRFDANCYIAITRKLDTHDVSRGRVPRHTGADDSSSSTPADIAYALGLIEQPTIILGIRTDGLFNFAEQQELAAGIPNSVLKSIESPDGHDAFLLEFEQVNSHLVGFLKEHLADLYQGDAKAEATEVKVVQNSTFGEAEDLTAW